MEYVIKEVDGTVWAWAKVTPEEAEKMDGLMKELAEKMKGTDQK